MDSLKQKARDFLAGNEAPEWATHVAVYMPKSFAVAEYCLFQCGEFRTGPDASVFFNDENEFFSIAELTEQGGLACNKDCGMTFNDGTRYYERIHKTDCAMYRGKLEEVIPVDRREILTLEQKLNKLCTEYSVWLRSDEPKKLNLERSLKKFEIADAAMRMYFEGYDELIELLEGEND